MQPDLFAADRQTLDVPVPAARHSVASQRAADRLRGCRGPQMAKLLAAYAAVGVPGLTSSEVHARSGVRISSICSLRAGAVEKGWLLKLAGTRTASDSGFEQDLHRITTDGLAALDTWKTGR